MANSLISPFQLLALTSRVQCLRPRNPQLRIVLHVQYD